jgi:NAD(P)H-nitrite reductase large subunit
MKRKLNHRPDNINKSMPEQGSQNKNAPRGERLICVCNKVPQAQIEGVISRGCQTLPKISTATTAGVGQCGGSCRPVLQKMLDCYLATGNFPTDEVLFPKKTR